MGGGAPCDLKYADDHSIPAKEAGSSSTYDVVDIMSMMEGKGKCDPHLFKEKAEAQTCGSRGPLPYKYPLLETKRCDMTFDCPYEEIGDGPDKVDEGAHCMEHCMLIRLCFN